jgi:hypothetical protein
MDVELQKDKGHCQGQKSGAQNVPQSGAQPGRQELVRCRITTAKAEGQQQDQGHYRQSADRLDLVDL